MIKKNTQEIKEPVQISSYFKLEKWTLLVVTISGILYNVGMVAGPWFEGQLVQRLLDILGGRKEFAAMVSLAIAYVAVIGLVQFSRFIKRLYVRKFANHINREMKQVLYGAVVEQKKSQLEAEGTGNLMTKAISDVDTCVEGMRKFTTELFDTGVVMIAYLVMLFLYDWRLTLLSMIFPPVAYVIAERLKAVVSKSAAAYKKSAGNLNTATMDRVKNAMTYRVYGQENHQDQIYEEALEDYEKRASYANIWENAMQPIYRIISTLSLIWILWLGGRNVLGQGWTVWNIAAFTTYLSCFTKLAMKSSRAAKLFNAVQKAKVSWIRIKPYLEKANHGSLRKKSSENPTHNHPGMEGILQIRHVSFQYKKEDPYLFQNLNITLKKGEILGVSGPVACGKSTFGKVFLGENDYQGSITLNGVELREEYEKKEEIPVTYMGHHPELLSTTIEENILLGEKGEVDPVLKAVCMEEEIRDMPDGIHTQIGNGGVTLSGGQQARIALARTLYHRKQLLILDDPFSAVDQLTEKKIMKNMAPYISDSMVIFISHRLVLFPEFSQVLWMGDGSVADPETMRKQQREYARMYQLQTGGTTNEA